LNQCKILQWILKLQIFKYNLVKIIIKLRRLRARIDSA